MAVTKTVMMLVMMEFNVFSKRRWPFFLYFFFGDVATPIVDWLVGSLWHHYREGCIYGCPKEWMDCLRT